MEGRNAFKYLQVEKVQRHFWLSVSGRCFRLLLLLYLRISKSKISALIRAVIQLVVYLASIAVFVWGYRNSAHSELCLSPGTRVRWLIDSSARSDKYYIFAG